MGKKPNMSSKHQPADPAAGGQSRPGVTDTRASSATESEPGPQAQQPADPEVQAARDEAEANFARYQRLAADFENYKRRSRQDLTDRTQFANEELLRKLLPLREKFDPAQHEAIASEETDEHEEGTIVEEMQPGYRLHNRVLRPTLVKVAHPRALKS
ncbi:MAG: nucleotide exchange factor GrpE [Chloroflexota bacterium]|nr:MAG: nucleotide exchange factor GrpE [Chloroflexota bacterium]